MIDENSSTVIVNIHGLLGEQDCIQMDFEEELLVEEEQFIIDNADILVDYFKEQALTKTDLEQDLARLATSHLT